MRRRTRWLTILGSAGVLVVAVPLLVGSMTGPRIDDAQAPWADEHRADEHRADEHRADEPSLGETGPSATGAAGAEVADAGSHDPQALGLLDRAVRAAQDRSYTGDQRVTVHGATGDTTRRVHVVHRAGQGTTRTVRSDPGGDGSGRTVMFHPDRHAAAPAEASVLMQLARSYRVRLGERVRVSGVAAREVEAVRPDGTVAARLAVADDTSLVLRREVLDSGGGPLRTAVFSRLSLLDAAPTPRADAGGGPDASLTAEQVTELRARGCICPERLPGGLWLFDTRYEVAEGSTLLHLTYSDGLSTLSLFSQPGRLDAQAMADVRPQRIEGTTVWVHRAQPLRLSWQAEDQVVTVVSDAPAQVVRQVVAGLPRQRTADPGAPGPRWMRGVAAIVEAANPL